MTLLRRGVRVSLTFRRALRGKQSCECDYTAQCDSQLESAMDLGDPEAEALERAHVHSVYESIAPHFSETRHTQWPRVRAFLRSLPRGALVVDAGCGNGKYLAGGEEDSQFRVSFRLVEC